ncbi:hypothetical protein GCM10007216_07720 [Thalassobacillus devorans]|uniref:DUF1659 domain-containing protein n=1 Tax=Thalassobacillus devorans TaxID=279813 RepID=A0ABQ1NLI8_9BACI|nr:DUF1659 domain-containing protein [Thalassobacillus devorans]NIK27684.1 hypothetical protein [Thalassobacillus devorans]GGC79673.1 hypothetical protein GCM10007216_07720 [Thalassobacillus devorans]
MAVTSEKVGSLLRMVLENGQDDRGNFIFKSKNFNNVKTEATAEQLYTVAKSLEPLQQRELYAIERKDDNKIMNI